MFISQTLPETHLYSKLNLVECCNESVHCEELWGHLSIRTLQGVVKELRLVLSDLGRDLKQQSLLKVGCSQEVGVIL